MLEYYVPAGTGEAEFVEKRSRFIGHVFPVKSEEEARAHVAEMKSRYHDARHNCWCCVVRDGGILRYSDDGEPQGTAGQPMLEVFSRGGITDVCCIVTRYFGGILLGAGGLVRAYSKTAKMALDAAGISVVRMWEDVAISCGYSLFERVRNEITAVSGVISNIDYSACVDIRALVPEGTSQQLFVQIRDMSAGDAVCKMCGTEFRAVPCAER